MKQSTTQVDLKKLLHDEFPELKVEVPILYETDISMHLPNWLENSVRYIKNERYVENAIKLFSESNLFPVMKYVTYDIAIGGLYASKYIDLEFRVGRHFESSIFKTEPKYIGHILSHEPLNVSTNLSASEKAEQRTRKETIHATLYGMSL